MNKYYFHVDVNSAYLSWEAAYQIQQGSDIDLRMIPSAVGGDPKTRRGIILAKSIPAKKYDIHTGETLYKAFQKCPHLTVVSPRYHLYMKASQAMHNILESYSPNIQRFSIDESFLDIYASETSLEDLGNQIRIHIKEDLGFTVNVGISSNKLLAKVASDFEKPDNVHTLFPHEIKSKMWPLPVEDLFMVGRATAKKLHGMNIHTIGDLASADLDYLKYKLKSHGQLIWEYANGIESSKIRLSEENYVKGIGNSTTLPRDINQSEDAHMYLLALTEMVAMRLRHENKLCSVVVISIKNSDLSRYSHQMTLFSPTDDTNVIYQTTKKLFHQSWKNQSIRHLGVRVTGLSNNDYYQYSLFDKKNLDTLRNLNQTLDDLRLKYGKYTISRGVFLHKKIKPIIGGIGEDDYKMMSSLL
ncbi:MAG: DNA polymerase IV [Clostridiales bacterium]|nr:DNA polymerase IV [Clostridiales bacterium]